MTHCAVSLMSWVFQKFLKLHRLHDKILCAGTCVQLWMHKETLPGGQCTAVISNVLLLFWRCYHCEISSHVSVLVWRDIYTKH